MVAVDRLPSASAGSGAALVRAPLAAFAAGRAAAAFDALASGAVPAPGREADGPPSGLRRLASARTRPSTAGRDGCALASLRLVARSALSGGGGSGTTGGSFGVVRRTLATISGASAVRSAPGSAARDRGRALSVVGAGMDGGAVAVDWAWPVTGLAAVVPTGRLELRRDRASVAAAAGSGTARTFRPGPARLGAFGDAGVASAAFRVGRATFDVRGVASGCCGVRVAGLGIGAVRVGAVGVGGSKPASAEARRLARATDRAAAARAAAVRAGPTPAALGPDVTAAAVAPRATRARADAAGRTGASGERPLGARLCNSASGVMPGGKVSGACRSRRLRVFGGIGVTGTMAAGAATVATLATGALGSPTPTAPPAGCSAPLTTSLGATCALARRAIHIERRLRAMSATTARMPTMKLASTAYRGFHAPP
jgi:hypothetical protein